MSEVTFTDLDAEHVVVYVSFQTLLFVEDAALQDDHMRRVPVEGYYSVVFNPWLPSREEVINGGFVCRPSSKSFCRKKVCEREWVNRLKTRHGISPDVPIKEWKKNVDGEWVLNSWRYFKEGMLSPGSSLFVQNGNEKLLYEQLMDVFDAVERLKRKIGLLSSNQTVVFITLNSRVNMVRAVLRWFACENTKLPLYTVVAMEEFIPASVDILGNISSGARHPIFSRCAMHPVDYKNENGNLFDCCRADVALLSRVGSYMGDYLSDFMGDAPVVYDSEATTENECF